MNEDKSGYLLDNVLVVIDHLQQWIPYYTSDSVISVDRYLQDETFSTPHHKVINLCSDLSYLSVGYYCSLLAQARKHKILPSIDTLNRLDCTNAAKIDSTLLSHCSAALATKERHDGKILELFFGKPENPDYNKIGRDIYEQYPAPLLKVTISSEKPYRLLSVRCMTLEELSDHQQDLFADNLDHFNRKVWRKPKERKTSRYDIAIFHDPQDPLPPSNAKAMKLFMTEGSKMGVNCELITAEDSSRLLEFDALFIRQTTAVDNITYRLAQQAEQAEMVVIDEPSSIIRCTNKVYLKELLDHKGIPTPKSKLLFCRNPLSYDELARQIGSRMVLKVPDGSFSIGIHKVETEEQYLVKLAELSKRSAVLLVQEFVPTEYDWRIGVLNGEAIYACKYFMARGHWQIYRHEAGRSRSGKCETLPVHLVPRRITKIAEKASLAIGKSFYGVDIKDTENGLKIIEINDNPSVDHGVEDLILGAELYRIILREFVTRLDAKRQQ